MENFDAKQNKIYGIANRIYSDSTIIIAAFSLAMNNITSDLTYGIATEAGYYQGYSDILLNNTAMNIESVNSTEFYGTVFAFYGNGTLILQSSTITMARIDADTASSTHSYTELVDSHVRCPASQ
jgi:hypothetical protein